MDKIDVSWKILGVYILILLLVCLCCPAAAVSINTKIPNYNHLAHVDNSISTTSIHNYTSFYMGNHIALSTSEYFYRMEEEEETYFPSKKV